MRNLRNYNPGHPEFLCLRSWQTKKRSRWPEIMMARPSSRQLEITMARPSSWWLEITMARLTSQSPSSQSQGRVHKVEANFAMARLTSWWPEITTARPSLWSPGQVCEVQAKFAKSRPEITTARWDHDGQARTLCGYYDQFTDLGWNQVREPATRVPVPGGYLLKPWSLNLHHRFPEQVASLSWCHRVQRPAFWRFYRSRGLVPVLETCFLALLQVQGTGYQS